MGVALEQHLNSRPRSFKTRSTVWVMDRNTQKEMPPQFQVVKIFPQRGYLCLHRLVKPAAFTCNRCSLGKTSKLVAFAKDNLVGVTACTQRSLKTRRARKSARR